MNRTLWNQGRVVGYSAYEIYVKQHMLEYPDIPPATEREWLAASLAAGTSMIVQLPVGYNGVDIPLPSTSSLAAANPVFASVFLGTVTTSNNWATEITDYGRLVDTAATPSGSGNSKYFKAKTGTVTSSQTFTGDGSTHTFVLLDPHVISISSVTVGGTATSAYTFDSDSHSIIFTNAPANNAAIVVTYTSNQAIADLQSIVEFAKIQDGVILQPGTISNHELTKPNFSAPARVRFSVSNALSHTVNVLLTGFTDAVVLEGSSGLDSNQSTAPQNGDFIGPAVFPQVAKMILCCPQQYIDLVGQNIYPITKNVHVEKSADGVNIGIRVDNEITSDDTTLLTSTQTNDGGQTVLSVKPKKIVDDGLDIVTSGVTPVKVTKTTPSGKPTYTIEDNLEAGVGIELSSSTGTPTYRKISTRITSGPGINIDTTNDVVKISATIAGVGYSSIYQDEDYEVIPYNQFCSYKNAVEAWDHNNLYLGVSVLEGKNIERYYKIPAGTAEPLRWYNDTYNYGDGSTNPYFHEYNRYYYVKSGNTYIKNTESSWTTAVANGLYLGCPGSVGIQVSGITNDPKLYTRIPNSNGNYIRGYQNMSSVSTQPTGWAKYGTTYYWTWDASASKMRRNTYSTWSDAKAQSGGLYRREHYSLAKLPYHDAAGTGKPQQNGFCIPYINSEYDYSNSKCGFAFRHGNTWNSAVGLKSFMFGIVFKGRFMYLNSLDYSFATSSGNGTGIWNMHRWNSSNPRTSTDWSDNSTYLADEADYSSFGGSWNAVCALDTLADIDTIHTPSRLIGYGGGYPDGYNGQLTKWSNLSGADIGKDLCSFWINLGLSGTFYF